MTDLERLYEWLKDENREPARTKFTAGELRNVAEEIEYQIWKAPKRRKESVKKAHAARKRIKTKQQ